MSKITKFFKPKESNIRLPTAYVVESDEECAEESAEESVEESVTTKTIEMNNVPLNDVTSFCRRKLNEDELYQLLINVWKPDASFKFPTSSKRNLKFQISWLASFPWLTYSFTENGAYCRFCIGFVQNCVGKGSHESLNFFVKTPFQEWKKALEKFRDHQNKKYHLDAMEDAQNFKLIYEKRKNDIITEIDVGRKKQQIENRKKLIPIIRTVLLCGRQGLALRGHQDEGSLSLKMPVENDGNFKALLRFALESGDTDLQQHLETAGANATYISATIQNEIIDASGKIILNSIVKRINDSGCFASIADETIDVSGIEQFSICARYVDKIEDEYKIREDFLCYVPVEDVTGKGLANTLLATLKEIGVNVHLMKGQGYDGASAMSGHYNGCAAVVRETCPEAIYVHCANHNLNLAIMHACKVVSIRNCIGTVKEIVNFFRKSNKAGMILKNCIIEANPGANQTRLLKFCETRWVEHLNSLNLFFEVFEHICSALEELDLKITKTDGVQPNVLLSSIRTPQFVISLAVLKPIFVLTKNLSLFLQKEDCDLSQCIEYANDLYEEVDEMRQNADELFNKLFVTVTEISKNVGFEISVPRRVGKQLYRENYEGGPIDYYRKSIYIPFLDDFLNQLNLRFLNHRAILSKIQNILPIKCADLDPDGIKTTVQVLKEQWPNDISECEEEFEAEVRMWRRRFFNTPIENRPKTFIDALNNCDKTLYRSIYRILKIGATLPVSVASSERSFSSLRRLKTYLRNRTGEDRLNGLALLNVHRDINVPHEDVLNILANKPRRILL